jgi:hypothetical protein
MVRLMIPAQGIYAAKKLVWLTSLSWVKNRQVAPTGGIDPRTFHDQNPEN